ncbi:MAG: hypothetical protein GYB21_07400 [Oceanospirillales bacterium]|nr:hypothetical protein [Oceanospirillales bacterium]
MDDSYLDRARNESLARKELSTQAQTLLVLRPLETILGGHLRKGYVDEVDVDMISAVMWLFDAMMYLESRPEAPGISRVEAEQLLQSHFREAYPGWPNERYEQLSASLFKVLVPNEPFNYRYYDFSERKLKEGVFRYISWTNSPCGTKVLFNLTEQGVLFYTTRLDENSLDRADIMAKKAQRTLRRGEIDMAIEHVQSTKHQMDSFMTRIRVGLRAVRSGDIQYSFAVDMRPLIEDAYYTLSDITDRLTQTLKEISGMRESGDANPKVQDRLRAAEQTFDEVVFYSREFRNEMGTVHGDFLKYRANIAAKREQTTFSQTLTEALLKPLLSTSVDVLQDNIDDFIQYTLPPHTSSSVDENLKFFDLKAVLTHYNELFDEELDTHELDDSADVELIPELTDSLPKETVEFAYTWVSSHLEEHGNVSFLTVLDAFDRLVLNYDQQLACLMVIGGLATSDNPALLAEPGDRLDHPLWTGDNVTVYRSTPIAAEVLIDGLTKAG